MPIILTSRHITGIWNVIGNGTVPPYEQRTLDLLKANQRAHLANNPAASEPQQIETPIEAYVGNGCWRVHCRCEERTHADPDFGAAVCFGCGAIWVRVIFPENRILIENLLAKRPAQAHRNWQRPETFDMLLAEQIAHGDPV